MAIQTETYQVEPSSLKISTQDDAATHGYNGPLKVSDGGLVTNVGKEFLHAAAAFDKERGRDDDPNALYSCNKYGVGARRSTLMSPADFYCTNDVEVAKVRLRFG
jgi:hypothetical protein